MKRRHFFATTLAALATLSLLGCSGGGGGGSSNSTEATRQLLTGNTTETSQSIRYWRTVSIKVNQTYFNSTGGDQPCPVTITSKDGSSEAGCIDGQLDAYRSDGKVVFDTGSSPSWSTTEYTFTINGSEITITNNAETDPDETRSFVMEVISSSDGGQRIRLRLKKETRVNGTDNPTNVGSELVIEGVV